MDTGLSLLIVGVALWAASHLFKRLAPGPRGAMEDGTAKLVVTVMAVAALVLMVVGYRWAEIVPVYSPMAGIGHLTDLLMLIAFVIFGAGMAKGVLWTKIRHPMLTGVILWAIAHLLVNGDLASILLFGGMGLWAVLSMLLINAQAGAWVQPASGGIRRDAALVAIAAVMYGLVAGVHIWLGHNPFVGTYG
jgi:uncharacterized membrane protein